MGAGNSAPGVREEVGLRLVDVHTHLWGDKLGQDADTLVRIMDRFDVAWIGVSTLLGGQQPTLNDIRRANDVTHAFRQREPDRVEGFCYVNPRCGPQAVDELRRCRERYGFRFIKLWISAKADDPCVFPLVERAIDFGMPILQHAFHKATRMLQNESEPKDVARLARRYPEARIIMAHMGADFIYGCNAVRDCSNVWSDMCGTYCETGMIDYALRTLGAERIVFGSDGPGATLMNNVYKVLDTPLTAEQKQRIFHDNAERLRQCAK